MIPDNILQQVITYNESNLALFQNLCCFVSTSNTKFRDFDQPANLGDVLSFDKPPRFVAGNSLVWSLQPADQRVQTLTVNNAASVPYAFSDQQFIFNVEDYIRVFGRSAMAELATKVEADVASVAESGPYRFYGDGINPINSYLQLADALALFREIGLPTHNAKGYLSNVVVPPIINSGLAQFAVDRNNELAKSWEVADFDNTMWYRSNLLKTHISGTEGQQGSTLTVVSTTLDAFGAVIAITFSGTHAASDPNSIVQYDSFQFQDGVSGFQNIRSLTWTGYIPCNAPVQFQATANAASTSGSDVTVSIFPPLQVQQTNTQNITLPIVAGMQVKVLPSHQCGLITAGDPLFIAMPRLPDQSPYATSSMVDPDTGVGMRTTYGAQLGQGTITMGHDVIWGKTIIPEYCIKLVFPLSNYNP